MSYPPSFNRGSPVTLQTHRRQVAPYDPTLKYNRLVDKRRNPKANNLYSFDAPLFLQAVKEDRLHELYKVTLAGQRIQSGVGIWDVLFNANKEHPASACVLVAQSDYLPLPLSRVQFTSTWLNLGMAVSRLHLNQVITGDRIGLCIRDRQTALTYVFIYAVEDICSVTMPGSDQLKRMPAINLRMEHAMFANDEGVGTTVDMDDHGFDSTKASAFVSWMFEAVYDLKRSWSWKPHFVPWILRDHNRQATLQRLYDTIPNAAPITAEQFEQLTRDIHARNNNRAIDPNKNKTVEGTINTEKMKSAHQPLPVMEVVTMTDKVIITFEHRDVEQCYSITKDEIAKLSVSERHVTNADLKYVDLSDITSFLVESNDFLGKNATIRYFTINY